MNTLKTTLLLATMSGFMIALGGLAAGRTGMLVMLIGALVVLSQFNVEVSHLLAGMGIGGFIVGFAL